MPRYADSLLYLDCPLSRYRINAAFLPCCAPLVDSAPADTEHCSELWSGACRADGVVNWVGVHAFQFGTESSACQDAVSSKRCVHASSMDNKHQFSRRLVAALDHAMVPPTDADRKKYLSKAMKITERQVGNYLNGEKMPSPTRMVDLAIFLGVSLDWLMTGRGLMVPLTEEEVEHISETRKLDAPDRNKVYRLSQVFLPPEPDNHKNAS